MDPYLEGHLRTSFHAHLATEVARQLLPRLRPKYIALPERKYLSGAGAGDGLARHRTEKAAKAFDEKNAQNRVIQGIPRRRLLGRRVRGETW
jgi:hypothetical protein